MQAEAFAGLNDLYQCEKALGEAEKVDGLGSAAQNGGWLRFDGSRLAEARGAQYMRLGRLGSAEQVLSAALEQAALAPGQSFRRRDAVPTDLATVGIKRGDAEQVAAYAGEALRLARQSNSGYVVRRLQALRTDLQSMTGNPRIRELRNEINLLNTVS